MKPTKNYGLSDSLIDAVRKSVEEALVGGQKKLDVDKDGKLEKSDFASLRAKKDAVDTKPKLKEDHPDEKEDKALIKKLIKKADVSDDEEDKALIKKTMNKEDVEQMDEAPLRTVNALVGYPKLNKKVAAKGTPGSEDERNKAAAGLKRDRSGLGRRAYTGDQHYDVRREEVEQMDEVKLADLPRRKVVGKSYGADYVDPEGADETAADMKKAEPKRKSGPQGTMKRRFIKDKSKLRMQYK